MAGFIRNLIHVEFYLKRSAVVEVNWGNFELSSCSNVDYMFICGRRKIILLLRYNLLFVETCVAS